MERAIQETAEYCRQRKAFGQSILDNQVYTHSLNRQFSYYISSFCLVQVVHYRLAELETEVELLRSLLYRTLGESSTEHWVGIQWNTGWAFNG
ncbi:hypothetical protein GBAR_LOCUS13968, partial [Geodia barretti]